MVKALRSTRPETWQDGPETVELHLEVTDPEVVQALSEHPDPRAREEFALTALRIGVLALRQARGRIDADSVRNEGERLLEKLDARLSEHRRSVTTEIASRLTEYFDPTSGRFQERVERLVRRDGELEDVLRRQVGGGDSELAKTLSSHFGETSPLMKALSPDAASGVLARLRETLEEELATQREGILREFSLDHEEGALSRLLGQLRGNLDKVASEFSLDREDSALSRLVREFSLDTDGSALARLKRELLETLSAQGDAQARFQQEVREALAAMQARKQAEARSTTHGAVFEEEVVALLLAAGQKAGDVVEHTGATTGLIRNCKVGDVVVELSPESAAAGAKIVVEAKEDASYTLARVRSEMETARKNRGAGVGLFVFSARSAPAGLQPLARYGEDVVVVWDAEDPASDAYLLGGLSVAKALSVRSAADRQDRAADFEAIERAIRAVEKQAGGLDEIRRLTETIRSNSGKVLDRARIMAKELAREIETLDDRIADLKEEGSGAA